MKRTPFLAAALLALAALGARAAAPVPPSDTAIEAARHAVDAYHDDVIDTLARLVSYDTVADPDLPCERNPHHIAFKAYLQQEATRLGLDFTDHGCVAVIGLGQPGGEQRERLGLIAHGDVQPVDAAKWKHSPFSLDRDSEPGRLLARGAEDDKGPIATALYAMKSLRDLKLPLSKRIELYVYMAEESDWAPLEAFVKSHALPEMNIALDAEYPAVVAEKGFGLLALTMPKQGAQSGVPVPADAPWIRSFTGGSFAAQIPEDARAVIANASPALEAQLRQRALRQTGMRYQFASDGKDLTISAKGVSAHSSKPEEGVNAIAMLADLLGQRTWPDTTAGALVNFLTEMLGTGYLGEKFGNIAYRDAFMGPMTVVPTLVREQADKGEQSGLELTINLRRPQGKSLDQLSNEINAALAQWQGAHVQLANVQMRIGEPWVQQDAPQLPTLLGVFSSFTGVRDPKPIAIGGGTNSRLFPHAVSFGPAMPRTVYTGHSEHEFITTRQLLLNLEMLTAALAELAK